MLRIHFTSADLARVTLGYNSSLPVSEAVMSLQALRHRSGPRFSVWRHAVGKQLPARASLIGSLVPVSGWAPDFLTPGPDHASPTAGAFDAIRATPRRRLTAELRRLSHRHRLPTWSQLGRCLKGSDLPELAALAEMLQAVARGFYSGLAPRLLVRTEELTGVRPPVRRLAG